ncbi:MAG: hypothetical protein PVH41_10980 [Anaerolineae bacterium]|jgi:hypothetical protein
MYRSTSYASQTGKTVFVEMAARSAETARLLSGTQAAPPRKQVRFLVRRAATLASCLLAGVRKRATQVQAVARG